jgi:hypothetical protein
MNKISIGSQTLSESWLLSATNPMMGISSALDTVLRKTVSSLLVEPMIARTLPLWLGSCTHNIKIAIVFKISSDDGLIYCRYALPLRYHDVYHDAYHHVYHHLYHLHTPPPPTNRWQILERLPDLFNASILVLNFSIQGRDKSTSGAPHQINSYSQNSDG